MSTKIQRVSLIALLIAMAGPAVADEATVTLAPINVEAASGPLPKLERDNTVGSYLGLTPAETPGMVEVITQEEMQERGLRDLIEVYNSVPGVRAGNLPGEPGVTSMRGFSRGATGYTLDGAGTIDPLLISRNLDSYNFEQVEVLRGPASVIQGTGALAGGINLTTKQPVLGESFADGVASYGSFNGFRAGAGFNQALGKTAALRSSLSYARSDGYVDDTDSEKIGLTTGLKVEPTDRLTLSASVDYFHDGFRTPYQGAPLIPRALARDPSDLVSAPGDLVIDKALRDKNYNVSDGVMKSDSTWLQAGVGYRLSDSWTLENRLSFYDADRLWANSEDFSFNGGTGLLDRSTTRITHDHRFWSNRTSASNDSWLDGHRNRFSAGVEYSDTDFGSERRFGTTSSVDPFDPDRGFFPADTAANFSTRQNFDSRVRSVAVFAEDAFNLTPAWLIVAGLRYENLDLDRTIEDLGAATVTRFGNTFDSLSWRVGTVYELVPGTALFAQYNQGVVPITSLLLSNPSRAGFDLSTGQALEAGIKASFWDERAVVTASLYQIEQEDILTRDPANPALTVQGGSQRTRGVELDVALNVTERWAIGFNGTVMDAAFTELTDSSGGDLSGNRPSNVPNHIFGLSSSYRLASLPVTFGAALRHVGSAYTDNANTIRMEGYTLLDASVSYELGAGTLTLRGRNLTDAFYAEWSGYSAEQVYIGAPRSFDLSYSVTF